MYLWRCVFAVVLGLVGYFSGFGYVSQLLCCCALGLLLLIQAKGTRGVCDSSTQTDCPTEEAPAQQKSAAGQILGTDEPDTAIRIVQKVSHQSKYPNIQKSLQHMFKCVYTNLVLPWSTAPEPEVSHPLHIALLTEFNFVVDEIICKAKDMDLSVIALGCIQIFTQHLHKTKQSEGSPAFASKAEEIALLRKFCKALIHNLFPKHLWDPNLYYCVLEEILAMNVLALVTMLSDPDNLNHLIISQLDQMPSETLVEEVHDTDRDSTSSNWSENSDVLQDETKEHPPEKGKAKNKGKKLKEKFCKVFGNMKQKKEKPKRRNMGLIEEATLSRRPAALPTDDDSSHENVSPDAVSLIDYIQEDMMEFKLSYEMWRVGKWAVAVSNVQTEGKEVCFTIRLEEIKNPENLHWDVTKNRSDIIHFSNQSKEIQSLLDVSTIAKKTEWNKEDATEILGRSLQNLVDSDLGKSKHVFQFLGPMDWILHEEEPDEGLWALLGGIAYFLTPGQDEEASDHKDDEKKHEVIHESKKSEATPQDELEAIHPMCAEILEMHDDGIEYEVVVPDGGHVPLPEQTSTCMSNIAEAPEQPEVDPVEIENAHENTIQFGQKRKYLKFEHNFKPQPVAFSSSKSDEDCLMHDAVSICTYDGNKSKEENLPHTSWDQPEANKVIFDLLKEICGNSYPFKFLKTVVTPFSSLINKKLNAFLKKMNPSEAQIATYIDSLCGNIWPDQAVPRPLPQSSDNKNEIKQKALHLMTSKLAGFAIVNKVNVETIFKIFQNAEENKKLVYMLLKYLFKQFLPAFNVPTI